MATTPTYTVNNPTPGTHYYAPLSSGAVPDANTTVNCHVQAFDSHGNLMICSTLSAYINDYTSGSNAASFTGSNDSGVNTVDSHPNGSDIFRAGGGTGQSGVAKLTMYLTYTGHAYNTPPNAPINLSPANTSNTNSTPTFSGTFSDPNSGDTMSQFEVIVNNAASGGGAQIWDSGAVNASSAQKSSGVFSLAYGGPALTAGSSYSFKARTADSSGSWGAYSGWYTFTVIGGPGAPTGVAPTGVQTSFTPAISFQYHASPSTGANMASYRYVITSQAGGAQVYDSGAVAASAADGATVSGSIAGGAQLASGGQYVFTLTTTDTNSATGPATAVSFSIADIPQVAPTNPINNATVNTNTPTFQWAYTDQNYTQASYRVQVINRTTGAVIEDTGLVASAATSYTIGSTIAYGTSIAWRVQVVNTAGASSGWSTYGYAQIESAPTVAITAPTSGGTVTTSTPTITWTYTPSTGGYAQASVQIVLNDANGNLLQTYTQAGGGTSFTIPVGVLINSQGYQVQVIATDTNSEVGQSAVAPFTVSYNPPADMQGQPLATVDNYLLNPYLNVDGGAGIAQNWTHSNVGVGGAQYQIDQNIQQPVALASGDGFATGSQKITMNAPAGAGDTVSIAQSVTLAAMGVAVGNHLSLSANVIVGLAAGGAGFAELALHFLDVSSAVISIVTGTATQGDTGGLIVNLLGPQNVTIPAGTVTVVAYLTLFSGNTSDDGSIVWFLDAMLNHAAASDANFIAGDLGTGYSYDGNGFSVRTLLAGNLPSLNANAGQDGDPVSAQGGTITLNWDTTLADATRFTAYLVERRRQDQSADDTQWVLLSAITDTTTPSYTDYAAASGVVYQYAIRQEITYSDGSIGLSQHRAIVTGSVDYSPAWYIVNSGVVAGTIYNMRLSTVAPSRKWDYKESAQYTQFLGRPGVARDAGPDLGFDIQDHTALFNPSFGDDVSTMRRSLILMKSLGIEWLLKAPDGMVIPVWMRDMQWDEDETYSDTMMTVHFSFAQSRAITDY